MSKLNVSIERINEVLISKSVIVEKSINAVNQILVKCKPIDSSLDYSNDEINNYEILVNRFSRSVETLLNFFRTVELKEFGEKSDTMRELLSKMEKIGIINSSNLWLEMRLSRNKISHIYIEDGLIELSNEVIITFADELNYTNNKIMEYVSLLK